MAQASIYYAPVKFERTRPSFMSILHRDNERRRLVDAPSRKCLLSIVVYQLLVNDVNVEL